MVSVEHDKDWVQKYTSSYIYAPLTWYKEVKNFEGSDQWYDRDKLQEGIKDLQYDLLLVDGPPGVNRSGIVKYIELFDTTVPIIFDDLQRGRDRKIINSVAHKLGLPFVTYGQFDGKPFGVINDPYYGRK